MATREVGIVITAKDAASKSFRKVGDEISNTEVKMQSLGSTAQSSLYDMTAAVTLLNQGFELARNTAASLTGAVDSTIGATLKLRDATDPLVEFFEKSRINSEMLSARIGDILTPVIVGLGKAIEWNDDTLNRYLETNRKLISLGMVDMLERMALTLVDGVGWGIHKVISVWRLFQLSLKETKVIFTDMFRDMSDSLLVFANKVIAVGEIFESEWVAAAGKGLRDAIHETVAETENAHEELAAMREKIEAEQYAAEKSIEQRINGIRALVTEGAETTRRVVEQTKAAEQTMTQAQLAEIETRRAASIEWIDYQLMLKLRQQNEIIKQTELTIALAKQAEAEQAAIDKQRLQRGIQVSQQITTAMATSFGAAITGAQSAGEAFENFAATTANIVIQTAIQQISAAAATAAAESFKSQAGIPIVGPILGAAAAGMAFAAVSAFKSKFAMGGMVTGGTPGQDTVPALLQRGEMVLNQQQARAYERGQGGGTQQSVTINANVTTTDIPQRQQRRRLTNNLAVSIEEAIRDGRIRVGGVA